VLKHRLRPVRGLPPDQATLVIADTRVACHEDGTGALPPAWDHLAAW
jgi:hypothetical protein